MVAQNDGNQLNRLYVPQIVDGGSWSTSFTIYNPDAVASAGGLLSFFAENGSPLQLQILVGGSSQLTTDHVDVGIPPNGSITLESLGQSSITTQGYATFLRQNNQAILVATFRQRVAGRPDFESTIQGVISIVPGFLVPYDNTNGFSTGFAMVNTDSGPNGYTLIFYDGLGHIVSADAITLGPGQHAAFSSPVRFPDTAGKNGVARIIQTSRSFMVVQPAKEITYPMMALTALRFNPTGASAVMPLYELLN